MENNSLALAFQGGYESRRKFCWKIRRDISLGIARGLAFLHEEVQPHIVHRDIKPANILLDKNLIPKIADFGLSKLFRENISHAWKEYQVNNLQQLVDPTLDGEFPEEEAAQVLRVGLLCVQETASLRPQMSAVVKMLEDDEECSKHVSISKPGHLPDLKHLRIGNNHSSDGTASSKSSTSLSTTILIV
ncbi:putative serine/threonine-protein kinase [Bienertia sinuspersici]